MTQIDEEATKAEDDAEDRKDAKTADAPPAARFDPETPFCTVTTIKTITCEMVSDLLITAVEGGSNYWCTRVRPTIKGVPIDNPVHEARVKKEGGNWYACAENFANPDFAIMIWFEPGETKIILQVDMDRGFAMIARERPDLLQRIFDAGAADAEDADVWLQYAAFGELVYG